MTENLTLFTDGLLSKWGFNDGDIPDDVLDYLEEKNLPYANNWREVLCELVIKYVIPVMKEKIVFRVISCNHNPIRAESVNGINVSHQWYEGSEGITTVLSPEWIEIPMETVIEVWNACINR